MYFLKYKRFIIVFVAILPMLWQSAPAQENDAGFLPGFKDNLVNRGISTELVYTGDFFRVANGGLMKKNAYLSNIDFTIDIDAQKLFRAANSKIFIYVLGNAGQSPSKYAGDAQTLSNIDAP